MRFADRGPWSVAAGLLATAILAAAILVATPVTAAAGTPPRELVAAPFSAEPPPRLTPHAPTGRGTDCRRWLRIASRLGETLAGRRLRDAVLTGRCALEAPRAEEAVWEWPWRGDAFDPEPPAQKHASFDAWEIRCDPVGTRRRCAALLAPRGPRRLSTHFVIDRISGREVVLWRIQLDGRRPGGVRPEVTLRLGGQAAPQRFERCAAHGCLFETEIGLAGQAATWLDGGGTVEVEIAPARGAPETFSIPSQGFREAFRELTRLKRAEERPTAGRP